MAKGKKGKRGNNKNDDIDNENIDVSSNKNDELKTNEETNLSGTLSRKEKRQQKLKNKQNQNNNNAKKNDDDDKFKLISEKEENNNHNIQSDSDKEDEYMQQPIASMSKKLSKKQLQKQKKKQIQNSNLNTYDDDESSDSEEEVEVEEEIIKPKNNKKQSKKQQKKQQQQKKKGFQAFDDDDGESEEDEIIVKPTTIAKKQQKKNKKKGFQAFEDSETEEEEEEVIKPTSKKQSKKQQQKNKKKGFDAFNDDDDDDESEEEEDIIQQATKKQSNKQQKKQKNKKKGGFDAFNDDDEEEDSNDESYEEEVIKPAVKSKSSKKKQQQQRKKNKSAFTALDDDGSSSSSSEEDYVKVENNKSGFSAFDDSDDDDNSEEEEYVSKKKKESNKNKKKDNKKGKNKQKSKAVELSEDSEEEVAEISKKKTSTFSAFVDSDEDEDEEDITKTKMIDDEDEKKKKKKETKEEKAAKKEAKKLEKEKKKAEKEARKAEKEARKAEKEARKAEKKALKAEKEAIKEKKGNEDHEEMMIQIDKNIKADSVTDNAPNKQDNNNIKEVANQIENLNIEEKKQETTLKSKTGSKLENKTQQQKSNKKKSKLELQIEAAMEKRKKQEEEDMIKQKQKEAIMKGTVDELVDVKKKKKVKKEEEVIRIKEVKVVLSEDEDDYDVVEDEFVGAPDDHAWTDKSLAMKESEKTSKKDELTHGPDGKKLSNKERKKLLKAKEAALRQAEYEANAIKLSAEGAQFACSQTAVNENDPQWQNALDIKIPSFSISVAGKILFKDSEFNISFSRRYGIVGPNGKGKSTLLKMIASGDMKLPPRIDYLYVEQEVVADDTPAIQAVLKADKERWNLLEEEKELTYKLDNGDEDPQIVSRLQEVYESLQGMGAEASESKARRILHGLGFSLANQDKATKLFSGGWRMRISLARALFMEPTLLMLDEPTNHLDLNAVIWLDNYLTTWKKTLLVVSHDQDFLNSVCQEILHIEDLKVVSYKGNYDTFKKSEKEKRKQLEKEWEKQQKRLRELKRSGQSKQKAADTIKKSSSKKGDKKNVDAIATGQTTATNMELIKRPKDYVVKLFFPEVPTLSRPVLEVHDVHFRYSRKHPVIFNRIDFGIDMDSRICVVGPNGAGKSTLLKLLTGEIEATKGDVRRNPRLRMGIYNQHFVDRLPMEQTPVNYLRNRYQDETYQTIRNNLGKFGLEGHAHEVAMRDLSGGQKARVVFVDLSLQQPHLLLLDEPTNNLDIETIDALIDGMNEFNGGIVVVTHDQRLIEECDCDLWVVEKMGVTSWDAGFDDYKESILKEMEDEIERDQELRRKKLEAAAVARQEKLASLIGSKKS